MYVCMYAYMHACMDVCIHICEAFHKWSFFPKSSISMGFPWFSHKPSSSDPSTSRLLTWAALAVSRRIIFVPFGSMPLDLADGNDSAWPPMFVRCRWNVREDSQPPIV